MIENWIDIDNRKPPFDTLVLVRGKDKEYIFHRYALAYNECYPPEMSMTQVLELKKETMEKIPVFNEVPFDITEWVEV